MISGQFNAFTGELPIGEVTKSFIDSLNEYGRTFDCWVVWYSGGKDSTTIASMIAWAIETGKVDPPKHLLIRGIDTRLEIPSLVISNEAVLAQFAKKGIDAKMVSVQEEKSLLVNIIGRGVAVPSEGCRWCTQRTKIEPQKAIADKIFKEHGRFLSITGYRRGESKIRDGKIEKVCSSTDGECGITFYQKLPDNICANLAPIVHFQSCSVWDWLFFYSKKEGWDFDMLIAAYGSQKVRFGCIGCPVVKEDYTLHAVVRRPKFKCYSPLLKLNWLFRELRRARHRVRRKNNEIGAISISSRKWALNYILSIQLEMDLLCDTQLMPRYQILNAEQLRLINEHLLLKTWPRGYEGEQEEAMLQIVEKNQNEYKNSLFPKS